MKLLLLSLVVVTWLLTTFLVYRAASFRKDRRGPATYFGTPFGSLVEMLRRDNYDEAGARLIPWLTLSLAVLVVGFLIAFWTLI